MSQTMLDAFFILKKNVVSNDIEQRIASEKEEFYKKCLISCNESVCKNEKLCLKTQISEMKRKCEQIESAVSTCNDVIEEKNKKIEDLKKMLKTARIEQNDTNEIKANEENENHTQVSTSCSVPTSNQMVKNELSFSEFKDIFDEQQLAELRSIGCTVRDDSRFISLAIKHIYKGRLECLKNKSVSGRGRTKTEVKEKVTPAKVTILEKMFDERIKMTNDAAQHKNRFKHLNKFIKDAIANINRSVHAKEIESSACSRLEIDLK